MNEIKNYYEKVLWFCAHLSSFVKSTLCVGLHHTKVGFEKLIHVATMNQPDKSKNNTFAFAFYNMCVRVVLTVNIGVF